MFQIESNVPLPEPKLGIRKAKYPFADMNVGDSFVVSGKLKQTVASSASRYARLHGKRFAVRKVPDGYRVWRIA